MNNTGKRSSKSTALSVQLSEICAGVVRNPKSAACIDRLLDELKTSSECAAAVWEYDSMPVLLLQETIAPYLILNTDRFDGEEASRLCVVLNILQILVGDAKVKRVFVDARFPYYIYKYLLMANTNAQYETLRIAALGVIASLLQNGDSYVHKQLKTTEIVPLLLKIIDLGSETSQMLSVNVFGLIIGSDEGLGYACQTFDRFSAINLMFSSLVSQAVHAGSLPLVRAVLRVYIRLCEKPHIKTLLTSKRPEGLFTDEAQALVSADKECDSLLRRFSELTS